MFDCNQAWGNENPFAGFWQSENGSIETYFVKMNEDSLPQHLSGDEKLSVSASPSNGSTSPHSFEVAPIVFRFEYEEPSVMTEKGFLSGVMARYAYNQGVVMFDCSFEFAAGSLDYDGSTWGGTPVKADTDDYLFEIRTLLGGNIYQGKNKVTPFLGFGLRYWNDTIQASGGYEREILYLYTPIGIKLAGPLSRKWSWGFSGEYDLFWKGWVTSHLSDADPGYNDPENTQSFGDGFGVRVSFQFRNHISTRFSWYIEPFFRYWDVGPSDYAILTYYGAPTGIFVYEPENNTLTYGVTFGFGF